jgi:predicted AAA+ superfamily ATPase
MKFVVTGSGSFDVKVQVGGYLVGRAIYFELLPLSFEEFLLWKAGDLHKLFIEWRKSVVEFIKTGKEDFIQPAFENEFQSFLNEYLTFFAFLQSSRKVTTKRSRRFFRILSGHTWRRTSFSSSK